MPHAIEDQELVVRSPYDDHEVGRVQRSSTADVTEAIETAWSARAGRSLPPWRRAEILSAASTILQERNEFFARIIAAEAAKPIKTARVEARRAASTFAFAASEASSGTISPVSRSASEVGEHKIGFTLRVPIGIVGAISPFNFPLNLVAHKVAPAIASGCPVVLKPASSTPLSAFALQSILVDECGLPPDHLAIVAGSGAAIGDALVDDPRVAMISFTGSPEVGWAIRQRAARKKVALELGNNAPVIIEPDADFLAAARKISVAGFSHAGQSCISTQRVYAHESIVESFVEQLVGFVGDLVVGDPLEDATDVSALISSSERDRVQRWVVEACDAGAELAIGGRVRSDGVLEPTVVTGATPDMKICSLEVFGPVVAVQSYNNVEQAIRLANDTRYGLQAAIFTPRLDRALLAARELDFGAVLVNEVPTWRADQMPYGGLRDSGNTREGPKYSVMEMTESRLVVLSGEPT